MYQEYKRILAPIDGSKEAKKAFLKAIQVARRNEASLDIAHIIDTRAMQVGDGYEIIYTDDMSSEGKALLADYEKMAHDHGLKDVHTHLEYGSPKQVITEELSVDCKSDLIMIGATGLSAVERLLVGSVSDYVIRNAPCDVLVVRTDLENKLSE